MTAAKTAWELAQFMAAHGHEVTNALRNQERHMREAAGQARIAALTPQEPRETAPGYVDITPTPQGFATMAETFDQAADSAAAAAEAWEALAERAEQEEL